MLIEFSVANFRSFDARQSLSMVAQSAGEHRNTHLRDCDMPSVEPLLLSAAIYGANGAGKSNLLRAFYALRSMVLNSAREGMRGDSLPYEPFGLTKSEPSFFEVIFIASGKRWQYGLKYDAQRVHEEYLLAYNSQKPTRIFERIANLEADADHQWAFSKSLKISLSQIETTVRSNALAISVLGGQLNSPLLAPVFDWFRQSRVINTHAGRFPWQRLAKDDSRLDKVFPFIQAIDPTLSKSRIKTIKHEFHVEDGDVQTEKFGSVEFCHVDQVGRELWLELDEESEGTQQLYRLMDALLAALERGGLTLIDELDNSLHPLLARALVRLFHDKTRNAAGAQLVFATHDATMLDLSFLRDDQIWFMEKGPELATALYSLADIVGVRSTSIEKGYLQGRFGAIPILGSALTSG